MNSEIVDNFARLELPEIPLYLFWRLGHLQWIRQWMGHIHCHEFKTQAK